VFEPVLKDFLSHRKRNKEDTIAVIFLPYNGKRGWFSKKSISGELKAKSNRRNIKEDPNKSKSISGELKAIKS